MRGSSRSWSGHDRVSSRREGLDGGRRGAGTPPAFIPLTVSPKASVPMPVAAPVAPRNTPDVQLEIVLRNGRRLLVPSVVDPEVLVRLLPALEGR